MDRRTVAFYAVFGVDRHKFMNDRNVEIFSRFGRKNRPLKILEERSWVEAEKKGNQNVRVY